MEVKIAVGRAQCALVLSGSVLDSLCLPGESIMAASATSRELFTDGVRAVLSTWPVLQVNTTAAGSAGGRADEQTDGTATDPLTDRQNRPKLYC